jgi:hypothetical protein
MNVRQIWLFDQEVLSEAGRPIAPSTRRVAAAAVFRNPHAGKVSADDFTGLAALSVEIGEELTKRVLGALGELKPVGYGKCALVGTSGDLEDGACTIHMRLGGAMRRGARGGPALIPGNAKVGPAGASIDLIFGEMEDGWAYGPMDTMTITIPDAPRPDEILLAVAFIAGGRPNARIAGASQDFVAKLVADIRKSSV